MDTVILPQVFLKQRDPAWSYDKFRQDKINFKKTIGDAVLEGAIPEDKLSSPSEILDMALKSLHEWIKKVEDEKQVMEFEVI